MAITKHELLVAHGSYINIVKCLTFFFCGRSTFLFIYSTVSGGTMPCGTLDGKHWLM